MTTLPPQPQDPDKGQTFGQQANGWGAAAPAGSSPAEPAKPPLPAGLPTPAPWWMQPQPQKKSFARRFFRVVGLILFIGSVTINVLLVTLWLLPLAESGGLQSVSITSGSSGQIVAVYTIEGGIGDQTVAEFRRFQQMVQSNADVKAVVVRVDSPGGTVSASDQIHHMVRQIQDTSGKPVVISMGGVAASGGYYVSAGAKKIIAEPTTITGSIGVISVWPVLKDFLDSHGVKMMTIRSRQAQGNKANENFWETPSDRTRKEVQDMLSAMHDRFVKVVREGRGSRLKEKTVTVAIEDGKETRDVQQIEPLNGKVYMADDAKANGLIDDIGYLADAVQAAAREAGLTSPKEVHYVKMQSFRDLMGVNQSSSLIDSKAVEKLMSPQIMMMWKAQ